MIYLISLFSITANSSHYAHYVFNTLDQGGNGILSFEVNTDWSFHSFKKIQSNGCDLHSQ